MTWNQSCQSILNYYHEYLLPDPQAQCDWDYGIIFPQLFQGQCEEFSKGNQVLEKIDSNPRIQVFIDYQPDPTVHLCLCLHILILSHGFQIHQLFPFYAKETRLKINFGMST
jgi:hypothetical protein